MTTQRFYEMIDACRPGLEDESQSDFRELAQELAQDRNLRRVFERSQKFDLAVQSALHSATPPAGLAERLLAAIDAPAVDVPAIDASGIAPQIADPATDPGASRAEPVQRAPRRVRMVWLGLASLAATIAMIVLWSQWPQPSLPSSDRDIAEMVQRWNTELDESVWQDRADLPAEQFPTWQHLDLRGVARWQWVVPRQIACYDFAVSEGTVRLFVMKPPSTLALPTVPPAGYPTPDGWHVGAWQANGRAYYLAVLADGDSKRLYSRVITSHFTPA